MKRSKTDMLSSLPDSLLVSILSLLTVKEAASTSVLSQRWTHLWPEISRLKISYRCFPKKSYVSTVDRIFEQLTSNKIHTFHLEFPHLLIDDAQVQLRKSALKRWFGYVCAHNVEEIKFSHGVWPRLKLPTCIFNCRSLVVLELTDGFRLKLPDDGIINLPNLNKLLLHDLCECDCETISTLFKSCPVLEVLYLNIPWCEDGLSMDISCQNLKSLTINEWRIWKAWNYKINAPKLEFFKVRGGVSSFRFVENPCLLTKANIKTPKCENVSAGYLERMSALLNDICSVQSLEVNSIPFRSLVHSYGNTVPTFHSLLELDVYLDEATAVKKLLNNLQCAPNLEALYFHKCVREKGLKWDVPYSVPLCLSQKIMKIKAMKLEGSKEDLEFLKYILDNANVLKSILVGSCSADEMPKEARFCKNLFMCPRSSKTCRIDFQGRYLHASSTDNQGSKTKM